MSSDSPTPHPDEPSVPGELAAPPAAAPPLTPLSLEALLGRIAHEWFTRRRIFDLPTARFWKRDDAVDLGIEFLGRPAATPIGPAAGPHSQMAQNIVLAWLGGSRVFELKTVQVIDDLEIARPCIDAQTIGYNIEWSQELTVGQSVEEYVKAWMLIDILRRWEPLRELLGDDPGPHVFDMSVGYDLAGISTPKVAGFIDAMRDASAEIERLRPQIAAVAEFAHLADLEFGAQLSNTVTLSTFHGCPPEEIESITKHLIDHHDLDVIVKLNPTLLGLDRVDDIVRNRLGYDEVRLQPQAFDEDLQFGRAIELIGELRDHAHARGHRFGIKLTNTLVVQNHRGVMPDDTMYLSGPPLHVLATALLRELAAALPGQLMLPGHDGDIMVSFSAGVTKDNVAATLAMGVRPATVCTDLLKPGGYGRLAPMLKALTADVVGVGASDLDAWRSQRLAVARAGGADDTVAEHLASVLADESYSRTGTAKLPRHVDHDLEMWGCVACNFCVTVCPNDAFFKLPSQDVDGLTGRQQYLVLSELCNECGNCLTFCPENGDPAQIKPRLYLDDDRFASAEGPRFHVAVAADGSVTATASGGADAEVGRLTELLNRPEGLPLR